MGAVIGVAREGIVSCRVGIIIFASEVAEEQEMWTEKRVKIRTLQAIGARWGGFGEEHIVGGVAERRNQWRGLCMMGKGKIGKEGVIKLEGEKKSGKELR